MSQHLNNNIPYTTPNTNTNQTSEENIIDLKLIVARVIQNWPLFAISIVLSLFLAFVYWYQAEPRWRIASKILVMDNKNSAASSLASGSLSGDIGSIFNAKSNADNEIQILKSRTLMEKTVKSMQLNISIYLTDAFKKKEIYKEAPFTVGISYKADTLQPRNYTINVLNEREYEIENSKDDITLKARFGDSVRLKQYNLVLNYIPGAKHAKQYIVSIANEDASVDDISKKFDATLSDKQATTIDLTFTYPHPAKGEAILNKITQLYLVSNLQNEQLIADSLITFIDSRVSLVSNELNGIEQKFERYKTANNIANISEQSKTLVASASEYYDKLAQQEIQLSIINDLERYLNNPKNRNVIPSSLINPTDQSFGQAINSYNDLLINRDKATLSYTEDNPVVENIDKQINNSRINLLRNIGTYKKTLQVGKQQLQKQNSGFTGQLQQLPNKERNYLDFSRQQNLKQELYLFLLQKREEAAISKNSTISSSRIIDSSKSEFFPFTPKRSIVYAVGLLFGLILPALYLIIKQLLDIRINSKQDIEANCIASIIGEIGHNNDKQALVTGKNSRSVISEQFRSLRTNMQFVVDTSKPNVLLFTSSMSGEGKSFLSLNLGAALTLTGKKVVLLELDLRKPKLSQSIGLSNEYGFTNYAISDNADFNINKLLKPLSFSPNAFLISSGPIPPNPAELLMNGKMEQLITYLKGRFDYVIIDCAPIGLVTDALMLEKHTDLTFYVTRQAVTYKSQLNIPNDLIRTKKVKNLYLIVNDVNFQKSGYSSYGQSYGYGGYGIEEEQGWLSKLLKRFK
jgi:tyrosine-protein kinase Etk/Wzc